MFNLSWNSGTGEISLLPDRMTGFLTSFGSFGRDQTCVMFLGLASGNTFLDTGDGPGIGKITTLNPELAAVVKQAFYDFGETHLDGEGNLWHR